MSTGWVDALLVAAGGFAALLALGLYGNRTRPCKHLNVRFVERRHGIDRYECADCGQPIERGQ